MGTEFRKSSFQMRYKIRICLILFSLLVENQRNHKKCVIVQLLDRYHPEKAK